MGRRHQSARALLTRLPGLCDEGHLAGVGTSVGADGTPSYTCQLGQETGNPVVGTAPHV